MNYRPIPPKLPQKTITKIERTGSFSNKISMQEILDSNPGIHPNDIMLEIEDDYGLLSIQVRVQITLPNENFDAEIAAFPEKIKQYEKNLEQYNELEKSKFDQSRKENIKWLEKQFNDLIRDRTTC